MALRARKTIKVAKGVNINLNKNSVGMSVGGKAGRVTVNSKGRTTSTVHTPVPGVSIVNTSTAGSSTSTTAATEADVVPAKPKKEMKTGKGMMIATILGGWFGLHRFASGQIGMGLLYLFTFGLFCVGWIHDIVVQVKAIMQ